MRLENALTEASTANATNMEITIVDLWNGDTPKYTKLVEGASIAVEYLKSQGVEGKAIHTGDGSAKITSDWKKWGGSNATPKTDFTIGNHKISLKKTGGSQLMSAKKGEASATCHAAIDSISMDSSEIVYKMEQYLNKFIDGKNALNITQQKKAGVVTDDILDATKMHKEFTKYLKKMMNDRPDLKQAMVFEAMTGNRKFGDNIGRANRVLVFDPLGINLSWDNTDDPSFIARKTNKTKVTIGFKSVSSTTKKNGKIYSYFSSFRLVEAIEEKIERELSEHDGILTEGVIKKITNRIKGWFANVWNKVKNWLLQSFDNVLTFFNLEPVSVMSDTQF